MRSVSMKHSGSSRAHRLMWTPQHCRFVTESVGCRTRGNLHQSPSTGGSEPVMWNARTLRYLARAMFLLLGEHGGVGECRLTQ